jgi:RNA polymerase sigma factor for flagellar operon FliA
MTKAPDLSRQTAAEPPAVSAKDALLGKNPGYKPQNHQPAAPLGDHLASQQEQVVVEHLPLVRFIARRVHERLPRHVPIDELYSAGIIGLLDAFGKFDSSKNVKFRSYAQFRIRGAILDSLRNLDWSPRELRRKAREVEDAIQVLTGQLHRSPTEIEIAQQLHIDVGAYQNLLSELKGLDVGTLHAKRSSDEGEEELVYVRGRPEDDPLFRYLNGEMRDRLANAINDLPERERLVMTLYYYEETAMREIGIILGVGESRVSQMHASAVLHLRARLAMSATLKEPQNKPAEDQSERARGREARQRIAAHPS